MSKLRRYFERQHQQALPPWLWLLYPACFFYGAAVLARTALYRLGVLKSTSLPVPVISIGNITTGGTGKTPIVISLSRYLVQCGKKVVVLSRGYGAKLPQAYAQATHPDYGDEAYLIQQAVPGAVVLVGRNRLDNAIKAISEFKPDVIVLDDGFQYLPLARQVDIMLVDGEQGFGNGHLLPFGPLREPFSALRRATAIAITKSCGREQFAELTPLLHARAKPGAFQLPPIHWPFEAVDVYNVETKRAINVSALKPQSAVLVSGIARPDSFIQSLSSLGIEIPNRQQFIFSDHHAYTRDDISRMRQSFPDALMITTEKDWVKLQPLIVQADLPHWAYLRVEPQIAPQEWQYCLAPVSQQLGLFEQASIASL